MKKLYPRVESGGGGDIRLFNTLSRRKETFVPLRRGQVSMYHCGPTVYDFAHIGNLRAYVFADILRRVFEYAGFAVKQVINITDVGHLTNDADEGEDKIEESAKRQGKSAKEITRFFTEAFHNDLFRINVNTKGTIFPKATEHIGEQIALAKTLEEKGYAYKTSDGIYFDTSRFERYGELGGINLQGLKEGARIALNSRKKNPADFALWKLSEESGKRQQEWESPWGMGFPGWHLECSAMAMKYLGKTFDIHTGGVDHIAIHHQNEIAQSECATGRPFVRYWLHSEHLRIEGRKISKSLGNTIFLKNLAGRGIRPLDYRYWLLTSHYRTPVNFTWEALQAAKNSLFRLQRLFIEELGGKDGGIAAGYAARFRNSLFDDLNTPEALAVLWQMVKDKSVKPDDKRFTLLNFDKVLGLKLGQLDGELKETVRKPMALDDLPPEIRLLTGERQKARAEGRWQDADALREKIAAAGFDIIDTPLGQRIYQRSGKK